MFDIVRKYVKEVYGVSDDEVDKKIEEVRIPKIEKNNPFIESMHLQDVQVASEIMRNNVDKKWLVLTDYDCDGISCAAIAYRVLKTLCNIDVDVITNKRRYGNGVNLTILNDIGLDNFKNYDVLITADHGSVDDDRYKMLKNINPNLKIIVTDHHEIPQPLKHVDAFINNQRDFDIDHFHNCKEGVFKEFSGCGILACLLYYFTHVDYRNSDETITRKIYQTLLAFTALTLVSDVMSMKDIRNRYIVKKGIPYVYALLHFHPLADSLSYKIIPMINSGNRMHCEELSYELLTAIEEEARWEAMRKLNDKNNERKRITDQCKKEAVFTGKHIGVGVVHTDYAVNGIIAGKMLDRYPAVICFQDNGKTDRYSGSCRSKAINILDILREAKDKGILEGVGGHKLACGCQMKKEKLTEFVNFIQNYKLKEEEKEVKGIILPMEEFTISGIKHALELLEPFGKDFEKPIFSSILKYRGYKIGKEADHFTPESDYWYSFLSPSKIEHRFYRRSIDPLELELNKTYRVIFNLKSWYFVGSKPELELLSIDLENRS